MDDLISIRVFSSDGHYLKNRVFLSRNYRLIVAPRKFDVLKTNIRPRSEASRANMLVLRTSNFQGATIRPIVSRHKHSIVLITQYYNFFRAPVQKSYTTIFHYFRVKCKIWERTQTKIHLIQFQSFIFHKSACSHANFHGRLISIRVFSADGHYLNNRVFLSRNYQTDSSET